MGKSKKSQRGAHLRGDKIDRAAAKRPAPASDDDSDYGTNESLRGTSSDGDEMDVQQESSRPMDTAAVRRREQKAESKRRCREQQKEASGSSGASASAPKGLQQYFVSPGAACTSSSPAPTPATAAPPQPAEHASTDSPGAGTGTAEAGVAEAALSPPPGDLPIGKKRGRPPKVTTGEAGGSLTTAESNASHRGTSARSLEGSHRASKAARSELRRGRSAAAAGAEPPPPPPADQMQRADAGLLQGPKPLLNMPTALADALTRMAAANGSRGRLERRHVVKGESLPAHEWVVLRDDAWELTRLKATRATRARGRWRRAWRRWRLRDKYTVLCINFRAPAAR